MICYECDLKIQDNIINKKDIIALNKKLLGRQLVAFFCVECLCEYLNISINDLPRMIERFKEDGCELF